MTIDEMCSIIDQAGKLIRTIENERDDYENRAVVACAIIDNVLSGGTYRGMGQREILQTLRSVLNDGERPDLAPDVRGAP